MLSSAENKQGRRSKLWQILGREVLLQGAALLESWLPFEVILYSSWEGEALTPLPLTWWMPQEVLYVTCLLLEKHLVLGIWKL